MVVKLIPVLVVVDLVPVLVEVDLVVAVVAVAVVMLGFVQEKNFCLLLYVSVNVIINDENIVKACMLVSVLEQVIMPVAVTAVVILLMVTMVNNILRVNEIRFSFLFFFVF